MGFRGREIEIKLIVRTNLDNVNRILQGAFRNDISRTLFGSSIDTYWSLPEEGPQKGQFIRMRERDGIRQITVKGKDRGSNINRIEIDVDSTSDVQTITKLLTAAHGKPAGRVGKTYYVHWLEGESEHTNVCCYSIQPIDGVYQDTIIEVETINEDKLLALEAKVIEAFRRRDIHIERASGSLYEMFILGKETK